MDCYVNHLVKDHKFENNLIFCPICGRDANFSSMRVLKGHVKEIHLQKNILLASTYSSSICNTEADDDSMGVPECNETNVQNAPPDLDEFSPDTAATHSLNNLL